MHISGYGFDNLAHKVVFPNPQAPQLIAGGLSRLFDAAIAYGIDPLRNLGASRSVNFVKEMHSRIARDHLGYDGICEFPCGAIHGGYASLPGVHGEEQQYRFKKDGKVHMAPYEWRIHKAIKELDPHLDIVMSRLQYAMEYLVLLNDPCTWLRVQELWGDLLEESPRYGRLYGGAYNQFVVNKNLLLDAHYDYTNHPEVLVLPPQSTLSSLHRTFSSDHALELTGS